MSRAVSRRPFCLSQLTKPQRKATWAGVSIALGLYTQRSSVSLAQEHMEAGAASTAPSPPSDHLDDAFQHSDHLVFMLVLLLALSSTGRKRIPESHETHFDHPSASDETCPSDA
jgi:hypothetical protein